MLFLVRMKTNGKRKQTEKDARLSIFTQSALSSHAQVPFQSISSFQKSTVEDNSFYLFICKQDEHY